MMRSRSGRSVTPWGSPEARSTAPSAPSRSWFASVLHRYGTARAPGLRELRDAPSPRAALVRVFEPAIAAGAAQRCLVLDMIVKMPDSSPAVAGLVKAAGVDLQERFGAAIERGRAAGEIAAGVDPFQAAGALLGLYLGRYVLVHSGVAKRIGTGSGGPAGAGSVTAAGVADVESEAVRGR